MALNPHTYVRKIKFALEYVKCFSVPKTCEKMGIPNKTGEDWFADPFVQSKITSFIDRIVADMELSTMEIIAELKENVAAARKKGDIKASNEALRLLGTYLNMFKESPDVVNDNRKVIVFGSGSASSLPSAGTPYNELGAGTGAGIVEGIPDLIAKAE